MTINGWIQIAIFAALVTAVVVPLGGYMARIFAGERTPLSPVLRPVDGLFYRVAGVEALRGVKYRPQSAGSLLFRNLMIYGVGG
jgi:potassium-transporting ATPase potassium-binding subunit